jgi:carbon-monoxide dehydrogenase medium subunit
MKPPKFEYHAPTTLDEAVAALARYDGDAKVLAGGQSLMPLLNFRLARPAALVDLNRIASLAYIREQDGQVRLGAMTRQRTIEFSPVVAQRLPLLRRPRAGSATCRSARAAPSVARIAHADPSAEYSAVLAVLEGEVVARGAKGDRVIRAADLFQTYLTTNLTPDEILTEVRLPAMPAGAGYALEDFSRRHGDFAIVGIAAVVIREGQRCKMARLATAGAGPVPVRLRAAEEILEREGLGEAAIDAAARRATELVDPDADIHASADYRRHLAGCQKRASRGRSESRVADMMTVRLVNGVAHEGRCEPRKLLVDFIREDSGPGTHVGCEHLQARARSCSTARRRARASLAVRPTGPSSPPSGA